MDKLKRLSLRREINDIPKIIDEIKDTMTIMKIKNIIMLEKEQIKYLHNTLPEEYKIKNLLNDNELFYSLYKKINIDLSNRYRKLKSGKCVEFNNKCNKSSWLYDSGAGEHFANDKSLPLNINKTMEIKIIKFENLLDNNSIKEFNYGITQLSYTEVLEIIKNTSHASNKKRSITNFGNMIIYSDKEFQNWTPLKDTELQKMSTVFQNHYNQETSKRFKHRLKYFYVLCNNFTLRYRDLHEIVDLIHHTLNTVTNNNLNEYCSKRPYETFLFARVRRKKTTRKPRFKINFPGGRAINVKEDKEGYTKTYHRQPVTPQQQAIINKRFKNGYSPFKDFIQGRFQLTEDSIYDKAKWVWRSVNSLNYIMKLWSAVPDPDGGQTPGALTETNVTSAYKYGQDQSIYINEFKYRYEIYNPTNYDMNLVIYDIVYKTDSDYQVKSSYYESSSNYSNIANSTHQNPLALAFMGTAGQNVRYKPTTAITTGIADPTAKDYQDITLKPTENYPFNILCKIIKKHTYRLQPGASMTHKFIHKPKCLMNRGYFMYKYAKNLNAANTSGSSTTEADTRDIGLKDITSGCLFKVWGCVTGTSSTAHNEVVNLTGKLMFKEYVEVRWDVMDQKYTYTFVTKNDEYVPGSAMNKKFEIVSKDNIVVAQEVNTDNTNNDPTHGTSTSGSGGNV
ncbi:hypothetical protein PIROE2DRAFT_9336 [Piromyces sp. E2]|nr:hypothetical protein PIROE2DRAFT_9336 [Piromyces sp. E2]|eukprot:OUM64029.1 hypothetical protein PIROE2DRAFT_9336 [Piromyces sp. E2]